MRDSHLRLLPASSGAEPHRQTTAFAPSVPRQGPVPIEIDRQLSILGRRAQSDPTARNVLYAAFCPRLDHWVWRAIGTCRRSGTDPAIEPADIEQQAYVVFCDLVIAWDARGSISSYLIAYFPWRLSDAMRRMSAPRGRRGTVGVAPAELDDGSHAAAESLAVLESLAETLSDRQGAILRYRIRHGLPWRDIATRLGIDIRTAQREWASVKRALRPILSGPDCANP